MKAGVVTTTPQPLERALCLALCGCVLVCLSWLTGCSTVQPGLHTAQDTAAGDLVAVYVARRKWHVDVGFAVADLDPSLRPLKAQFRTAKYLFFGFGDRRYLLTRSKSAPLLLRALWPGPALILVTAIENSPALAFGQAQVLKVELNGVQARALQAFIRGSMPDTALTPLAPGPYEGSAYFAASRQYSALHTCNTWAAEALRAGGQPIHSKGVVLAGQLWRQAARLAQPAEAAAAGP
jgi:hypothetical protein